MNDTEITGQKQKLQLIFTLAWSSTGTAWERFLASFITGCVTLRVITDAIMFLAIAKQKAMRNSKEHMVIAFMSFFDWLDANWLWCAMVIDYGLQTRFYCFFTFRHALWFMLGGQTSTAMLAMISVDRFMATSRPTWYWKAKVTWIYKLVGIVVAWQGIFDVYLIYNAFINQDLQGAVPYCFTSYTFGKGFDMDNNLRRSFLLASIVIYIGVLVQYKRYLTAKLNKVGTTSTRVEKNQWNRYKKCLRSMTKTLGISACITLCLYIMPLYAFDVLRKNFPSYQQYGWICFALISLSSVANLFLFSFRHKEVRKAVQALFEWKQLPNNMDNWFVLTAEIKSVSCSRPRTNKI